VEICRAIASGNRRKLLTLLCGRERSVQELMPRFDVSMGAVPRHLKILLASGLVTRRKDGRFRYYRANPAALRDVHDWTARYRRFGEARPDRLEDHLDGKACGTADTTGIIENFICH